MSILSSISQPYTSDKQTKAKGNGMYLNLMPGLDHLFEPLSAGSFSQDFTICLSLQWGRGLGLLARICLEKSQSHRYSPGLGGCGYK